MISISNLGWNLEDALEFIRKLQIRAWEDNLHIALAGSVLNKGESKNDLDIIVMGQNNGKYNNFVDFMIYISKLGMLDKKTGKEYETENRDIYGLILPGGKEIDFFIYDMKMSGVK